MSNDIIKRPAFTKQGHLSQGKKTDICSVAEIDGCVKVEINFSAAIRGMPTDMVEQLLDECSSVLTIRKNNTLAR